jgi:hypothetical protein
MRRAHWSLFVLFAILGQGCSFAVPDCNQFELRGFQGENTEGRRAQAFEVRASACADGVERVAECRQLVPAARDAVKADDGELEPVRCFCFENGDETGRFDNELSDELNEIFHNRSEDERAEVRAASVAAEGCGWERPVQTR